MGRSRLENRREVQGSSGTRWDRLHPWRRKDSYSHQRERTSRFPRVLGPESAWLFQWSHHPLPQSAETAIASIWSAESGPSGLSGKQSAAVRLTNHSIVGLDDEFRLVCWVKFSALPAMHSQLRLGRIRLWTTWRSNKEEEAVYTWYLVALLRSGRWVSVPGVSWRKDLIFRKLFPPIPSSERHVRLGHVKSPEEIPDCGELDPVDHQLSNFFLSPPPEHIHIVVQVPTLRAYSHYPFMSPILNNIPSFRSFQQRFPLSRSLCTFSLQCSPISLCHVLQF